MDQSIDQAKIDATELHCNEVVKQTQGEGSSLVSRNISVSGHRTSVRLEPEMWDALKDIVRREGCTLNTLCTLVQRRKRANSSLTAAIRVFIMLYYRAAATDEGHAQAGHGFMRRLNPTKPNGTNGRMIAAA